MRKSEADVKPNEYKIASLCSLRYPMAWLKGPLMICNSLTLCANQQARGMSPMNVQNKEGKKMNKNILRMLTVLLIIMSMNACGGGGSSGQAVTATTSPKS
jgi:hypothetical protein